MRKPPLSLTPAEKIEKARLLFQVYINTICSNLIFRGPSKDKIKHYSRVLQEPIRLLNISNVFRLGKLMEFESH